MQFIVRGRVLDWSGVFFAATATATAPVLRMDALRENWRSAAVAAAATAVAAYIHARRSKARSAAAAAEAVLAPVKTQFAQPWQELQTDDVEYIKMTQALLARSERPLQSDFLVAATLVYWTRDGRLSCTQGVNSETCVLPSAICAERCALLQLRLRGDASHVRAVYITTSAADTLITPGLLCREMLSEFAPPEARVVLFTGDWTPRLHPASGLPTAAYPPLCGKLSIDQLGRLYPLRPIYHGVPRAHLPGFAAAHAAAMQRVNVETLSYSPLASVRDLPIAAGSPLAAEIADALLSRLTGAGATAGSAAAGTSGAATAASKASGSAQLLFASPGGTGYAASDAAAAPATPVRGVAAGSTQAQAHGHAHSALALSTPSLARADAGLRVLESRVIQLYEAVAALAARGGPVALGGAPGGVTGAGSDSLFPIHFAAGVLFADGSVAVARQDKGLEYGCTIDAVAKLTHVIEAKASGLPAAAGPVESLDTFAPWLAPAAALEAGVETAHDGAEALPACASLCGSGCACGPACSCSAGSSCGSAAGRCSCGDACRCGPGCSCSSSDVPSKQASTGCGCGAGSSGASGASATGDSSHLRIRSCSGAPAGAGIASHARLNAAGVAGASTAGVAPILLLHVDQFGICHAPHASARAWLTEYGYGDCSMLIHAPPKAWELQAIAASASSAPSAASSCSAAAPGSPAATGAPAGAATASAGAMAGARAGAASAPAADLALVLRRVALADLAPGAPHIQLE